MLLSPGRGLTRPSQIGQASSKFEKKHQITIPFPDPPPVPDLPYKVLFASPSQFNVVGSYVTQTMLKSATGRTIDMIVEMPEEIFQDKDYLNLRYFYKKAYYLAVVTAALRKKLGSTVDLSYEYLNGNQLLPVLALIVGNTDEDTSKTAKSKSSKAFSEYRVRIIPSAPEGLFLRQKLLPSKNCVRSGSEEQKDTPTPFYNSTLWCETLYVPYLKVLRQAEKTCPAFRDASILGRVWLQQRGFGGPISSGGFGGFEWAILTALLLQGRGRKGTTALSASLSSTQLFKAIIQQLATFDLSKKPLILGFSSEGLDVSRDASPVILDAIRQHNIAFKMSPTSASMLQQYAKWTHTLMTDQAADQFNPTFIIKADPLSTFDVLIQLEKPGDADKKSLVNYRGVAWSFSERVHRILKKALGDRAQLIYVQENETGNNSWDISSPLKPSSSAALVGIIFNTANMARQVDHGPSVEDKKEAKKFRQFWGQKAELRRFNSGHIMESLIWTKTSPFDLCEEIVRYILELHLKVDDFEFYGKTFSALIPKTPSDPREAFNKFEQDLRSLEGLPLNINQVAATGAELRAASISTTRQPTDTVLFLEASGKWPENLSAIQRMKVAFLLRISSLLEEAKPGVTTHLGVEHAQTDIENQAFLDVVYDDDSAFRLRIHSDLEHSLLERAKEKQLLASYRRHYEQLPLHTQTMTTLGARFPALSPTIRLLKQWFNCHKLSFHFTPEMMELMALRCFLEPHPWQAPSSSNTGLLRTLQFLSRWDWRTEPIILDTDGSLSQSDRNQIATRLEAWRKLDPNMNHTTLFIATSNNSTSGTAYSTNEGQPQPHRVIATRMTLLARSSCKLVKEKGMDLNPQALFQTSLKDYDIIIHLDAKIMKSILRGDGIQSQFKNLDRRTDNPLPMVQHPVTAFLKELNAIYAGTILWFHGGPEDLVVAGLFNPQLQRRSIRNLPYTSKPAGDDEVELDRESIVAEVARLGGDCITNIETANRT